MEFPVFDLHCDTASSLMDEESGVCLKKNKLHIDLERAQTLPGYAQCFACFTTTYDDDPNVKRAVLRFEKQLAAVIREVNENSDRIRIAYSGKEIEKNQKNGLMSAILTMEGTAGIGFDPALLEDLYKIGFRIVSLGWNEENPLTGSNITGSGLTDLGKEFVKEAQRLGILIDVSHISDKGFWDIMDITQAPIIATHSNSRKIWNVPRNLTDDMFLAICQTGGVAGFNQYSAFVGENPNLNTACDHILRFMELDPSGTHIALGGDLDGCDCLPHGFSGVQDYPSFAQELLNRGLDEKTVYNIFWNNALGVMDIAVRNNAK